MSGPPFRAEHVGSFLRPPEVLAARARRAAGEITDGALRAVEDAAIAALVARQEQVGLGAVTDGELRRTFFHVDFLERLDGVTVGEGPRSLSFRRDDGTDVDFRPPTIGVDRRLGWSGPIQGADFDYLSSVTDRVAKVCIPSPSMLHFRGGREAISTSAYPDLDAFFADLAAAYQAEIADLATRGCRYLQLDDTNLAYLCDPSIRQATHDRGDDPDELTRLYCALVNDALRGRPDGMVVGVHLCRGNFRSAWVAQGGYEPVAEILFAGMDVDVFFLEYDDERSGDFAPLRHVPPDKTVVLGLMSSKQSAVESADAVAARIEEAAAYLPLDQLALSHQCGFSSTVHGNELTAEDQWVKLERCVEVAETVWGS